MARSLKGKYLTASVRLYGIKLKKTPKPSSVKYSDGTFCNFIKSFKNKTNCHKCHCTSVKASDETEFWFTCLFFLPPPILLKTKCKGSDYLS